MFIMKKRYEYIIVAASGSAVFTIDFITKHMTHLFLEQPVSILPGFTLAMHTNTGIAFSLPVPLPLQIFLTLVFLWFLTSFFLKAKHSLPLLLGFGFIVGGALGNFWERMLFGAVTDFLAIWRFPVFNMADAFLFIGVCLLLVHETFFSAQRR